MQEVCPRYVLASPSIRPPSSLACVRFPRARNYHYSTTKNIEVPNEPDALTIDYHPPCEGRDRHTGGDLSTSRGIRSPSSRVPRRPDRNRRLPNTASGFRAAAGGREVPGRWTRRRRRPCCRSGDYKIIVDVAGQSNRYWEDPRADPDNGRYGGYGTSSTTETCRRTIHLRVPRGSAMRSRRVLRSLRALVWMPASVS